MKKNMLYLATGAVFLVFAVCIAYVFTEPSPKQIHQASMLAEQDASQLLPDNGKPAPNANDLVFTAQNSPDKNPEDNGLITEPPKTTDEQNQASENTDKKTDSANTAGLNTAQAANTETKPAAEQQETPAEKNTSPSPQTLADKTNTDTTEQKKTVSEKNTEGSTTAKQDKLPVPFDNDPLRTKVILESRKNANTIIYAELFMDGNQVGLVFEGNNPIKPKTFRLNNPERVVVDIEGYWILKLPKLISNRMVKEIRSNAQKDKTRIVFEAKVPLKSSLLYRIHSRKYQLVFK